MPLPNTSPSKISDALPNAIKVLGTAYRVEVTELDSDTAGDTDGIYRRIRISEDYDSKRRWRIFVHEWVHAVLEVNGVSNVISSEVNEVIAQSMEHAVEELLQQVGRQLLEQLGEKE